MQGNGPINRKKKVTGTADESSMQTHGEVVQDTPVGDQQGYQDRKEQQSGASSQRGQNPFAAGNSGASSVRPISRPKNTTGQSTGNMNTYGMGNASSGPQQNRPAAGSQPNAFYTQSRPQPASNQQQSGQSRPQQQSSQTRPQQQNAQTSQNRPASYQQSTQRAASTGGKRSPLLLIIIAAAVLLMGGGGLSGLFGGGGGSTPSTSSSGLGGAASQGVSSVLEGLLGSEQTTSGQNTYTGSSSSGLGLGDNSSLINALLGSLGSSSSSSSASSYSASSQAGGMDMLQSLLGGSWYGNQTSLSAPSSSASTLSSAFSSLLNREVAAGSRSKFTAVRGGGKDTATIMVYMCGTDLESRSAMGTKDLQEMLNASLGNNLKLLVYTGGCSSWRNDKVSSQYNQIWQIDNGKMTCLNKNAGTASMTNPATLSSFIQYCAKNFPANRYALILWDHGSGSVSGYGYDEKNSRSGSMSLAGLNTAFRDGGVKFDFIGFDACLMATVENALMASKYADYLIASEETEPGIGWYYTDWLTAWGKNPSMATLDIGQKICDDFVSKCSSQCRGQQTTLSLIDLAELEHTVPDKLTAFSKSVSSMITNKEYKTVSNARTGSREFAVSSKIDQVDLADLCFNLDTTESAALAKVLKEAVKYNRINNISDAHGLSIYFPYQKVSNVDKAVSTYAAIGMDDSYAKAIRDFAGVEVSGQAVTGGTSSVMPSLFGMLGSGGGSSSASSDDMIGDLLSAFLGGGFNRVSGLDGDNTAFLSDRALEDSALKEYLTANILDVDKLKFTQDGDGYFLTLPADQWALVTGVEQNVFYDNGSGYVDLGLDNLFEIDATGRLQADMDGTWLALNGQVAPYYHETSESLENGGWIITGHVPALLNENRVDLLVVFDSENEDGYVAGARTVYSGETETVAKAMTEIQDGDTIILVADLYDYDQNYTASYRFGKPITVQGGLKVSNVYLPDKTKAMVTYRITDIYNQAYWTPVIGK